MRAVLIDEFLQIFDSLPTALFSRLFCGLKCARASLLHLGTKVDETVNYINTGVIGNVKGSHRDAGWIHGEDLSLLPVDLEPERDSFSTQNS